MSERLTDAQMDVMCADLILSGFGDAADLIDQLQADLVAMAAEWDALRAALAEIAGCISDHPQDVVAVARKALAKARGEA